MAVCRTDPEAEIRRSEGAYALTVPLLDWQPLATETHRERVRVLRLVEAVHHVVAVIAAQGVRERRRRQGGGTAKCHLSVRKAPHLFDRKRYVMGPVVLEITAESTVSGRSAYELPACGYWGYLPPAPSCYV
jgi:hypothetical protein